MTARFKVGESGKIHRVAAGFDMSLRTELTLTYIKPDGTTVTKTQTASQVQLGAVNITDPDLGALLADQYVIYIIEPGFLDQANTSTNKWKCYLTYTNTGSIPNNIYIGDCSTLEVVDPC